MTNLWTEMTIGKLSPRRTLYWFTIGKKLVELRFLWRANSINENIEILALKNEITKLAFLTQNIRPCDNFKDFYNEVAGRLVFDHENFSCVHLGMAASIISKFDECKNKAEQEEIKSLSFEAVGHCFCANTGKKELFEFIFQNRNTKIETSKELSRIFCDKVYDVLSKDYDFRLEDTVSDELFTNFINDTDSRTDKKTIENPKVCYKAEKLEDLLEPDDGNTVSKSENNGVSEKYLFISYSSKDYSLISKLKNAIEEAGIKCWMAPDSIRVGEDYSEVIVDAIENSSGVVFCVTENSQTSKWVPKELDIAIGADKIVYPIHLDESLILKNIRFRIINSQMIEFQGDIKDNLSNLIKAVNNIQK